MKNRNKGKAEIFKLQRAIGGNGGDLCLVYNKTRNIVGQFPTTKVEKKILGDDVKAYYWGIYNETTTKVDFVRKCTDEELVLIDW